jgi:glutathione S-transferase
MPNTTLIISSKNYSSWCLSGWMLCKIAGLPFIEEHLPSDDPSSRAELLLLSPSFLVPCLNHEGIKVWDTLSIAEYLGEIRPQSALFPESRAARAHCRSVTGEMHAGFSNLRAALPMDLKADYPGFAVWAGAQADIDRIVTIWHECFAAYKGPFLFGKLSMADAMYAATVTRFNTYHVALDADCAAYCKRILELPMMVEWIEAAKAEPDDLAELELQAEF